MHSEVPYPDLGHGVGLRWKRVEGGKLLAMIVRSQVVISFGRSAHFTFGRNTICASWAVAESVLSDSILSIV